MAHSLPYARLLLNTVGLVSNLFGLYNVTFVYENPYAAGFGGHYQYLTILGLSLSTFAFALNILRCFVPGALQYLYEAVICTVTPLEGLVSVLYWSMTFVDPHLLVPKDMPPIPAIVDCSLHLHPMLVLWFDFMKFSVDFKRSHHHVGWIAFFGTGYYFWSLYCSQRNGKWAYPFLDGFSPAGRVAFYVTAVTSCWAIYEAGIILHAQIHRPTTIKKQQ